MPLSPITAPCLENLEGISHGFFTREGGCSNGTYTSLNCGLGSSDDRHNVLENRARVARHLGADDDAVLTVYQVHSPRAVIVDHHIARDSLPEADAMVTRTPGLAIGILTADCAPALFADPVAKVIGAAHAGWRGAVSGVLEATVQAMQELGASRANIRAAVGPCICQENYEVGPEFEADLVAQDPDNKRYFMKPTPGARAHFNLPAYALNRLANMGLAETQVMSHCTFSGESTFFSYRRSKSKPDDDYGRQISAIVIA